MNNYEFGNYIYQLRKDANLSQQALAEKLGVTNKAVSKWENGQAKPSIDILNSLALLFNISVDDLLLMRKQKELPKITKIVVTGGPCAGKSTAISWIQNAFTKLGYKVIFIPETSTELITAGINLSSCNSPLDFEKGLVKLQLEKEKIYEDIAKEMPYSKILIVCDRGVMDNKAYVKPIDFLSILRDIKSNETILRDSYDAVFHLVSAAKGAEKYYTLENNQARSESIEDAAILDDKIISAWTGHPHFRIIDNSSNFDIKMKKLIAEISLFLGEPEPYEIERKFLIEYPDIDWLEKNPKCQRVEIIQTYLKSSNDDEIRVRQRGLDGNYIYFQTIKRKINSLKRIELEKRLSKDEYLELLMEADNEKRPIRKTRYCLTYHNQYFEIDIYPFWNKQAIAEIELRNESEEIKFPKKIKVLKEVTNDYRYKNAYLASIK